MSDLETALRRMAADPHAGDAAAERVVRKLESAALPPQKRALTWWPDEAHPSATVTSRCAVAIHS